jgi:glycosyltransferase involved in cell wall biosynthesis
LVKAFASIAKQRHAELRIFGEDFLNGSIQKLCKELGVESQIEFLHVIPYHQIPEQYAWADVMLHTSMSEGQSMAITEAAASGVLLAGTRVGLLHDLGDECGLIVEVGDFEGLAAKVLNALDNESWNKKVQKARDWTDSHDLQWTINELKETLHSILRND